jgi:hypothetical protein
MKGAQRAPALSSAGIAWSKEVLVEGSMLEAKLERAKKEGTE